MRLLYVWMIYTYEHGKYDMRGNLCCHYEVLPSAQPCRGVNILITISQSRPHTCCLGERERQWQPVKTKTEMLYQWQRDQWTTMSCYSPPSHWSVSITLTALGAHWATAAQIHLASAGPITAQCWARLGVRTNEKPRWVRDPPEHLWYLSSVPGLVLTLILSGVNIVKIFYNISIFTPTHSP